MTFEVAWQALMQRFENTMRARNFPASSNPRDWGLVLPDRTDVKKLTALLTPILCTQASRTDPRGIVRL
jgi:hypothetical protein